MSLKALCGDKQIENSPTLKILNIFLMYLQKFDGDISGGRLTTLVSRTAFDSGIVNGVNDFAIFIR